MALTIAVDGGMYKHLLHILICNLAITLNAAILQWPEVSSQKSKNPLQLAVLLVLQKLLPPVAL